MTLELDPESGQVINDIPCAVVHQPAVPTGSGDNGFEKLFFINGSSRKLSFLRELNPEYRVRVINSDTPPWRSVPYAMDGRRRAGSI